MALDGILLNKITENMQAVLPARIQKIYEISNTEVLLQVHCASGKKQILISAHSVYNRMLITERSYPTPDTPDNFTMVLRKYLEGGTIQSRPVLTAGAPSPYAAAIISVIRKQSILWLN